jgi:hypothetical protein
VKFRDSTGGVDGFTVVGPRVLWAAGSVRVSMARGFLSGAIRGGRSLTGCGSWTC